MIKRKSKHLEKKLLVAAMGMHSKALVSMSSFGSMVGASHIGQSAIERHQRTSGSSCEWWSYLAMCLAKSPR